MDWVIDVLVGKIVTAIASFSSIASLVLTFIVFLGVRKIKKFYIFTARVPELKTRLSEIASKISSQLDADAVEATKTREILADAEVALQSLCRKVGNPLNRQAKRIIDEIRTLNGRQSLLNRAMNFRSSNAKVLTQEEQLRNIYMSLYKLIGELKELYEDSRWEQ